MDEGKSREQLIDELTEMRLENERLTRALERQGSNAEAKVASVSPNEMLQVVVDAIPQHIFWKNRDSLYLGSNTLFAKVAGLAGPDEMPGKTDFDLAWKREEAEFFREVDRKVMDSGEPQFHIVEPQQQADGKQAWLDTNKIPLRDDSGEVIGILGTFEDITARVEMAESLRGSKAALEAKLGELAEKVRVIEELPAAA